MPTFLSTMKWYHQNDTIKLLSFLSLIWLHYRQLIVIVLDTVLNLLLYNKIFSFDIYEDYWCFAFHLSVIERLFRMLISQRKRLQYLIIKKTLKKYQREKMWLLYCLKPLELKYIVNECLCTTWWISQSFFQLFFCNHIRLIDWFLVF
jgi:hypothetical protein